jgi:hypothetical protein
MDIKNVRDAEIYLREIGLSRSEAKEFIFQFKKVLNYVEEPTPNFFRRLLWNH